MENLIRKRCKVKWAIKALRKGCEWITLLETSRQPTPNLLNLSTLQRIGGFNSTLTNEALDEGTCQKPEQRQSRTHGVYSHGATENLREARCSLRSYFAHILHTARISNVNSLIWVNGTRKMVNFRLSKKGDLFVSSQTLNKEENILCLREESNVTDKLEYLNKKWDLYSIEILAIFVINKNFSTFFRFFAFLQYLGTLRIFLLSKLFAWENILTVIVRYPKLPNHATIHTSVLFRSIFGKIMQIYIFNFKYHYIKFWLKNSRTRLLTLRESVAFRVSVLQVFSHWTNREMTQLFSPVIPKCLW